MKRRDSAVAIACLVFFALVVIFQINLSSVSRLNVTTSTTIKVVERELWATLRRQDQLSPAPMESRMGGISCDRSDEWYDVCSINGQTLFDPTTSTFFALDPSESKPKIERIRPYPRKFENYTMARIKELTLTTTPPPTPTCEIQHNIPALVFSAGGYTGNFFHEFNDGFIPLFITINSIFPNQDFVLVISKSRDWWAHKYADLLRAFTSRPIVNLDEETFTHCFVSATLGLISHGFMTINPTPNSKTLVDFHYFLERAYTQNSNSNSMSLYKTYNLNSKFTSDDKKFRPRLILVSRDGGVGRLIVNQEKLIGIGKEVGFDVILFNPKQSSSLRKAFALINSSHAMMGVHGAGLTHFLFLRPGSVFMQIVPIGTEWVSDTCFGKPARKLGLHYIEYKIGVEETSLVDKYGKNDMVVRDPVGLQRKGWSSEVMDIYLKEQDVKLDLLRFKGYLEKAYRKAERFMKKEG